MVIYFESISELQLVISLHYYSCWWKIAPRWAQAPPAEKVIASNSNANVCFFCTPRWMFHEGIFQTMLPTGQSTTTRGERLWMCVLFSFPTHLRVCLTIDPSQQAAHIKSLAWWRHVIYISNFGALRQLHLFQATSFTRQQQQQLLRLCRLLQGTEYVCNASFTHVIPRFNLSDCFSWHFFLLLFSFLSPNVSLLPRLATIHLLLLRLNKPGQGIWFRLI